MSGVKKFGIVAGEQSGDILGASLMISMRERFPNAEFVGVGGSEMVSLGCESLTSIDRLSVMGFVEPLSRLPELLSLKKRLQKRFFDEGIDTFIGIDSPDFNLRLAKALRGKGLKTIHFVSPSVWAYREKRIFSIKNSIDLMLTLFPFEQKIYKSHDVPSVCVGHPLADQLSGRDNRLSNRESLGISEKSTVIALLPGSRVGEINRLAPIFIDAAIESLQRYPGLKFVIPFSSPQSELLVKFYLEQANIIAGEQFMVVSDSHMALNASDFVITASGTATLEALFLRKPMVICYKMAPISFAIGSRMLKVPYIGLPNLLAGELLVPEYLQGAVNTQALFSEIDNFMSSFQSFSYSMKQFDRIHETLRGGASDKAAEAIQRLVVES